MISRYEDLSLGKFKELLAIQEGNDIEKIAVLSGLTTDALLHLPLTEYRELRDKASFLAFEPSIPAVRKSYRLNGITYVFKCNYRDLTTAQYVDFTEYQKQEGDTMIELLSLVLIPKGKAYNEGYDIIQAQEDIRDYLAVTDAIAIRDFFFLRLENLLRDSLTFLEKQSRKKTMTPQMRRKIQVKIATMRALLASGGGHIRLTAFPNSHALLGARSIQ